VNLVGHVAVTVRGRADASPALLAGAMLPDLGAIARIRLRSPDAMTSRPGLTGGGPDDAAAADLAVGIAGHHATDAAFHGSAWFREHNRRLLDALLDAGVERGPARASAHAGLEMLLDGELVGDPQIVIATRRALRAVGDGGEARAAAVTLAAPEDRTEWAARLDRLAGSLDPEAYTSASGVALRLQRMTRGRRRIELRDEHVTAVTSALEAYRSVVARDSDHVVDDVLLAARAATRPLPVHAARSATA